MNTIYDSLGFNPVAWYRQCVSMACNINEPTILTSSEFTTKFREAVKEALREIPEIEHQAALAISNKFGESENSH